MKWTELYRCVFAAFMVVWFFRPLKEETDCSPLRRTLYFVLLLCMAPIYVIPGGGEAAVVLFRFGFRTTGYTLWLRLRKGRDPLESLYYGALCWVAFTTQNNIFMTPELSFLRWNQVSWSTVPALNQMVSGAVELLAEFLILSLISRAFPFQDRRPVDRFRLVAAGVAVVCELYVKTTLKTISEALPDAYMRELTMYPILLQILLTASLVLLERHLSAQARREQEQLDEIAVRYRYESTMAKAQAGADLRQLHHDMKNHLLGMLQLVGENQKLERYIGWLLQSTKEFELLTDTGSSLLDGLLSEKVRRANRGGVDLTVNVDFRQGGFLNDMDLCIIFGNALDNAIEASLKVEDREKRGVLVKCGPAAGNLVITVTNYYEGDLKRSGGVLLSSKSGPGHGIGLASIRRTAERYGGVMTAEADGFRNFVLSVLIPIPDEDTTRLEAEG